MPGPFLRLKLIKELVGCICVFIYTLSIDFMKAPIQLTAFIVLTNCLRGWWLVD